MTNPVIERRAEQHYIAVKKSVLMQDIPVVLPPVVPQLLQWMAKNRIPEDGPVFFRYLSLDGNLMEVEVGVPVTEPLTGDGEYLPGKFAEGSYAVYTYQGDYAFMKEAHMHLEKWIAENGYEENKLLGPGGPCWSGRTEFYITDPDTVPDPADWITEIVFLLKD